MIKSDILKYKLTNPNILNNKSHISVIKSDLRKYIAKLRADIINIPTKKVFFSKIVLGNFTGISLLNVKYDTRCNLFGYFIKIIKSQKSKRNKGLDFICWSNYFSYLLSKLRYLILIALQNPEFLQRAFRKFRFQGSSYLYLSRKVIRGLSSFSTYFGEFTLDRGSFLFYAGSFNKFMELMYFLYSDNFYQDFIILKLKINDVLIKDPRFLFFFQSIGFNKLVILKLLQFHCINFMKKASLAFSVLHSFLLSSLVQIFLPLKLYLLKYVYIYASWKRLS